MTPYADDSHRDPGSLLRAIGADVAHRCGLDGRGILIGFADYGFDVLHPALRSADGMTSRFSVLCDQPSGLTYEAPQINQLIDEFRRTRSRSGIDRVYDPHANGYGTSGRASIAHGTLMASIAAGSTAVASNAAKGIAPAADLMGVHLDLPDHAWQETDAEGLPTWLDWQPGPGLLWEGWRSYAEHPAIPAAIRMIYETACMQRRRAVVINLSIGTWAGPHDGQSRAERVLADVLATSAAGDGPAAFAIIGAGNAGAERGHFHATIAPGGAATFDWLMLSDDRKQNKLEVWYPAAARDQLDVVIDGLRPSDPPIRIPFNGTAAIESDGRRVGIAQHDEATSRGFNRVRMLIHPGLLGRRSRSPLRWTILIASRGGTAFVPVHAWVERTVSLHEPSWLEPASTGSTLCSLAGAAGAIVVAGYDHHAAVSGSGGRYVTSSCGPLPWIAPGTVAARVPHLSAPAHFVWGARSKSTEWIETSGTSAAAAVASGAAALVLQQHLLAHGSVPQRDALVSALLGRAGEASLDPGSWSPAEGYGRLSLAPPEAGEPAANGASSNANQSGGQHARRAPALN